MKEIGISGSRHWWEKLFKDGSGDGAHTIKAFVIDFEHEINAVLTVLQAQLDLMQRDLLSNNQEVNRFQMIDRTLPRVHTDVGLLYAVSELANTRQSKNKTSLRSLIADVAAETQSAFRAAGVELSASEDEKIMLTGNPVVLRKMLKGLLQAALTRCKSSGTLQMNAVASKSKTDILLTTKGAQELGSGFKAWKLGDLRSTPTDGDGIRLAAVDAMARLHGGELSVAMRDNEPYEYRLSIRN